MRSYSVGSGAPVAVWPRARTRVASPSVPTPHEYPGNRASSPVHEPTVRVFRSRKGPGPRRALCPRAGRRALVVVRGAAAAGRALRASPRPVRRRRAAARAALRPRRRRCGRLRERALQHHRVAIAVPAAADRGATPTRPHRVVVGRRMRGRSIVAVRGRGRAGTPAPAPPLRRCRKPHALGASAGVRGHGAAGRAGGTAPTARSQTPPFHIGMGKAAAAAGDGGAVAGDGGAGDARALRCRRRAARLAAQHTAAGWRVRTGRAPAAQSPLSASRADEEQLPAAAEQVRERRARVGGRGRGRVRRGGRVRAPRRRQEGGAAAEGDAVVGAHGRAARGAAAGQRRAAALRDGAPARRALAAAPAAARRVTRALRARTTDHITLTFHYRDDDTRRGRTAHARARACARARARARARAPPGVL